ncbi:MAG TPA: ABC transporter permease [Kofleriaceae bacterium]|nr:ABC transporter permease [Kofleriaceae bacterium]
MSYEVRIGWRYLYQGAVNRGAVIGCIASLVAAAVGAVLVFATDDVSGLGVVLLGSGMLAAVICFLLAFFSVFVTVSVLGVVLGVAALTLVLAVTTGFQQTFREKVLGVNAHVIITKMTYDFTEYRDVEKLVRTIDPEVIAEQPFVFVEMLVTRGHGDVSGGVMIKGVDPERVTQVLDIKDHMQTGSIEALNEPKDEKDPPPIILGQVLADKLDAEVGETVTLVAPLSNIDVETLTPTGKPPKSSTFKIAGTFYSGFDEYDRRLMYVNIADAQALLGRGDRVRGVELKLADISRAKDVAKKIEKALKKKFPANDYLVQDWYALNQNLFTALTLQKIVLVTFLTLIIAVAAVNMISALTMMVTDKTREIAILKSMGATAGGIARTFQVVGIAIGGIGTALGLGIGLTLCEAMSRYNFPLDPRVYLIDSLPVDIQLPEVLMVAAITMALSVAATLFPSLKASALSPVAGLRGE